MRKNKVILGLAMIAVVGSSILIPNAAGTAFNFSLTSHGGGRITESVTKGAVKAAVVNVTSVSNNGNLPIYVRIRRTSDNAYASQLVSFYYKDRYKISYNSGYGAAGIKYYMRMQTDSNSTYAATVKGDWTP